MFKKIFKEFKERSFLDFFLDLIEGILSAIFSKVFIASYIFFACYSIYSFSKSHMNLDISSCYQIREGDTVKIDYKAENDMNIVGMNFHDYVFVIRKQAMQERSCLGSVSREIYYSYNVGDTTVYPLVAKPNVVIPTTPTDTPISQPTSDIPSTIVPNTTPSTTVPEQPK